MVEVKTEKSKALLPIFVTESKNTQPCLGLNWLNKLEIGLQGSKSTNIFRKVNTDERHEKSLSDYENIFHRINNLTIDIQLKKEANPIQQKWRPDVHVPLFWMYGKSWRETA